MCLLYASQSLKVKALSLFNWILYRLITLGEIWETEEVAMNKFFLMSKFLSPTGYQSKYQSIGFNEKIFGSGNCRRE